MSWRALLQEAFERSVVFTQFICFLNVFSNHVAEVHQCLGPSMLPTFNVSGDILLLEHLSSKFEKIKPGDVVMARSPANPRLVVCKRVLGLEGDTVTVLPTSSRGHIRQATVPKGHVWLQGDNSYNSTDSRHYGPVPYALIQGKVFYRIWPPEGWGPVLNQPPSVFRLFWGSFRTGAALLVRQCASKQQAEMLQEPGVAVYPLLKSTAGGSHLDQ